MLRSIIKVAQYWRSFEKHELYLFKLIVIYGMVYELYDFIL